MKIARLLTCEGYGASYVTDLAALRSGAAPDGSGLIIPGRAITPGFESIRQAAPALCVMIELENGQIAFGDCVSTIFPGREGRSEFETPEVLAGIVRQSVAPLIVGADAVDFRKNDDIIQKYNEVTISPAVKYGVSQALLHAAALARNVTMVEVLCDQWQRKISSERIQLNLQTGPDVDRGLDRIILRRGDIIHSRNPQNVQMLPAVIQFINYARERLQRYAPVDYRPRFHIDFYGVLGRHLGFDEIKIADYLLNLANAAMPYKVIFGDPVEMDGRRAQIDFMASIRARVIGELSLVAEEYCLDIEDHLAFIAADAADYLKIRPLDLANIGRVMDLVQATEKQRRERKVGIYYSGSGSETDVAARTRVHIGAAINADFMLCSPGMGVDEAHSVMANEFSRLFTLVRSRR